MSSQSRVSRLLLIRPLRNRENTHNYGRFQLERDRPRSDPHLLFSHTGICPRPPRRRADRRVRRWRKAAPRPRSAAEFAPVRQCRLDRGLARGREIGDALALVDVPTLDLQCPEGISGVRFADRIEAVTPPRQLYGFVTALWSLHKAVIQLHSSSVGYYAKVVTSFDETPRRKLEFVLQPMPIVRLVSL